MKISEYIKKMGRIKISEICNWDIADIRLNLIRNTDKEDSTISREMQKFKQLVAEKTEIYRRDPRLIEVIEKLKGGE